MTAIPTSTIDYLNIENHLPPGCVLMTYRGSISHGMFIPNTDPNSIDDVDLMGVYVESPSFYAGLENKTFGFGGKKTDTQEYWVEQYDIVNYELRKLFGLLLKNNPNVLMLLFLDKDYILYKEPLWDEIVNNRFIFLSKKAFYSFGGYAEEQLRKMTSGNHQGYMGEKRKALVEKFGYDVKNGAHLVRLLRMGTEYLKRGTLTVDRTNVDADELLSIKRGEWSLEEIKKEANRWNVELKEAFLNSNLPETPDWDAANRLCTSLIFDYYERLRNEN